MTVQDATLILSREPRDDAEQRVRRAALTVLGFESLPLDVIQGAVTRTLSLAEIAVIEASRPTRAA